MRHGLELAGVSGCVIWYKYRLRNSSPAPNYWQNVMHYGLMWLVHDDIMTLKHYPHYWSYVSGFPFDVFFDVRLNNRLTHWDRVTHICVSELDQAIIWTNPGILSFEPLGTNFNEISIAKWQPFCLSLNVLTVGLPTCRWCDITVMWNFPCFCEDFRAVQRDWHCFIS